jgi:hypothetical protein
MAIRLFGQRKSEGTTQTGDGAGVSAAQIAEAFEGLTAAAVSTTWQCRHSGRAVLAEGSADFAARAVRTIVLSGKSTLEYIRMEGGAYRCADPDAEEPEWESFTETDACGLHAFADPAVIGRAVRAVGAVQQARKPEDFDGTLLTVHQVALKPKPADPDKVLARLARQLRDHGASTMVASALTDADGQIVRLRLDLPHWTPADDPTADHAVTLDFSDLNEAVEIEQPDPEHVSRRRSARGCFDLNLF